jgi:hypothetical protein
MLAALALGNLLAVTASPRPPNAKNITVYGLRPYNLTGDLVVSQFISTVS